MNEIETLLNAACEGLLFQSETDAPLTPFFWPAETEIPTPQHLLELAKFPTETNAKTTKLETFFANATRDEDWHNAEEKAQVERFKNLEKTLKDNLENIKVFRLTSPQNDAAFDIFIVGEITKPETAKSEIASKETAKLESASSETAKSETATGLAGIQTKVVET